jgi:7-carboxy-7-deazaguanine synthase
MVNAATVAERGMAVVLERWRSVTRPGAGELLVSEISGPTLQGEVPSAWQAAAFVRLGGCNLSCRWCDTAYTWD